MSQKQNCILYVSGMHCAACELVIERKLRKMKGVSSAKASLNERLVNVTGHDVDVEELNKEFAALGYSFSLTPVGQTRLNIRNVFLAIGVFIFFTVIYLVIED